MLLFTAFDDADKILRPTTWYLARPAKRSGREHLGIKLKKRLVSLFGSVCSKAKCRAAKKLADIKMIGERPPTEETRSPYMRKRFTA